MPLVSKNFSDIITFTRASTGTYFDSAGVLQTAAINAPRFDYNPATLAAQGFLIEEQRTNSIRNNTMQGAVAGTPGTLPTNWSFFESGSQLTSEVVATGTENGITYIDIKVAGTVTAQRSALIFFEPTTGVVASAAQSWTQSLYLKLQAGSTANIEQINIRTDCYSSVLAFLSSTVSSALTVTSAALNTQRQSNSVTTPASTAFIQPMLRVRSNASGAIDITLRIGLPQLELGAFATSVIPTTTTALTRSADVASVNTLSPWYNATEGTLFAQWISAAGPDAGTQAPVAFNDTTTSNQMTMGRQSARIPRLQSFVLGVNQVDVYPSGTIPDNTSVNTVFAYKLNDYAMVYNGGAPATDNSATVPTATQLQLGRSAVGPSTILNGYLRRVTYYPRRLSDAELQAITA